MSAEPPGIYSGGFYVYVGFTMKVSSIKKTILLGSIFLSLLFCSRLYAGEVNLTWDRPTTNVDATCISDHAGFNLYYNTTSGDYSTFDDIGDIACTDSGVDAGTGCGNIYNCSYTKTGLGEGAWYFYVTSYDTAGNESDYSNEASTEITIPKLNTAAIYVDTTHVDIQFSESVTGADEISNYSADKGLQILAVTDQGGNVFRLETSLQTYGTQYTITASSNILNSDANGIDPANNTAVLTVPSDTDGDSIPDSWEIDNFGDLSTASGSTDYDGDNLPDKDEYSANTDPKNRDHDGDGIPDGWEVANSLDPLIDDSAYDPDEDGFSNLIEYLSDTNPNNDGSKPDADFGDAEDPLYPSKDASRGAKHLAFVYEWLGNSVDGEPDSRQIDGDRFDDGIVFTTPLEAGVSSNIKITVSVLNSSDTNRYNPDDPTKRLYLNSWFDWNNDGDWDDEGEKVIGTGSDIYSAWAIDPANFVEGSNSVDYNFNITPPVNWVEGGYARFRLDYGEDAGNKQSISGDLSGYLGTAQYGEVEDYIITGDSDGDGIPDSEDNNPEDASIATPESSTGSGKIIIDTSLNPGTTLAEVKALSDTDPDLNQTGKPPEYEFKHGLISFTVNGLDSGETVEVTLEFPDELSENARYFKINNSGFYEFSGASISGKTVTLLLTDGGNGDNDGESNGIIKDPGGVAEPVSSRSDNSSDRSVGAGGKSKTGCFIATAAYGSLMEPHVRTLRDFRDNYLLTNRAGRFFVELYYKTSPPIADYIAGHDSLRAVTRWALAPLVYGAAYPFPALLLFISLLIMILIWKRKKILKC